MKSAYLLKLKRLSRIIVQKWAAGRQVHAFCAFKWEKSFMTDYLLSTFGYTSILLEGDKRLLLELVSRP